MPPYAIVIVSTQKGKLELKKCNQGSFLHGLRVMSLMVFRVAGLIGDWFNQHRLFCNYALQFTFVIVTIITIASGIYVFGQNYIRDKK